MQLGTVCNPRRMHLGKAACGRRFDNFFSNCTAMYGSHGCKVDFMAVHYYGCTTADLQRCTDPLSAHPFADTRAPAPARRQRVPLLHICMFPGARDSVQVGCCEAQSPGRQACVLGGAQ